jgi:hypothetical protein
MFSLNYSIMQSTNVFLYIWYMWAGNVSHKTEDIADDLELLI